MKRNESAVLQCGLAGPNKLPWTVDGTSAFCSASVSAEPQEEDAAGLPWASTTAAKATRTIIGIRIPFSLRDRCCKIRLVMAGRPRKGATRLSTCSYFVTLVETAAVLLLAFGSAMSLLTVTTALIGPRPWCALTFTPMLVVAEPPLASVGVVHVTVPPSAPTAGSEQLLRLPSTLGSSCRMEVARKASRSVLRPDPRWIPQPCRSATC